VDFDTKR
jgi:hypothetical protein